MIKSISSNIDINKIKIPRNFGLPAEKKIIERYIFYKKTGCFDREILVDEHYNLIDGYSTYLVCKMVGLTKIRVLRLKVKLTAKECLEMAVSAIEKKEC